MADALNLRIGVPFPLLSAAAFNAHTIDQNTDQWEAIFQAPAALTINQGGFRIGTVAGTSPVYKISLQGVDGSGNPDGTIKGGASPASKTFQPSALGWSSSSWHWVTFDNTYACSRGEYLALVIARDSGVVASETFAVGLNHTNSYPGFPLCILNDNGSRTKWVRQPVFGFGTTTAKYGWPLLNATILLFNSGSTPDEVGIKFTLPSGWGDTYKIKGVEFIGCGNAGDILTFKLYDSDGSTVLQSVDQDSDYQSQLGQMNSVEAYFDEANLSSLSFGTAYRLTVQSNAGDNCVALTADFDAAGDMDPYPLGQNCHYTHRTDSGAWTDVTTKRLFMNLILDDVTEPAGGGGGGGPVMFGRTITC